MSCCSFILRILAPLADLQDRSLPDNSLSLATPSLTFPLTWTTFASRRLPIKFTTLHQLHPSLCATHFRSRLLLLAFSLTPLPPQTRRPSRRTASLMAVIS